MVADDTRSKIAHVRGLMLSGAVTQEKARELANPIIEEMNRIGAEIAKRHGKKFKPFTFTALMR